jgi:arylsulfatase A-like enzyme
MGEHRLLPGKMTAFDTDIRVPLVITGPGIRPGTKISALAENIDLAPTFEALAGRVPPPGVDGRSLVPLLDGRTPPDWRHAVLVEHHGPDINPSDPDFPAPDSGDPPSYEAMRFDGGVYVEYVDGEREYYDTATDPDELRNIYGRLGAVRRAMLHRDLLALEHCHGGLACHLADRLAPPPTAPA